MKCRIHLHTSPTSKICSKVRKNVGRKFHRCQTFHKTFSARSKRNLMLRCLRGCMQIQHLRQSNVLEPFRMIETRFEFDSNVLAFDSNVYKIKTKSFRANDYNTTFQTFLTSLISNVKCRKTMSDSFVAALRPPECRR